MKGLSQLANYRLSLAPLRFGAGLKVVMITVTGNKNIRLAAFRQRIEAVPQGRGN